MQYIEVYCDYEKKASQARRKVKGHLRQVKLIGHEGWRASQYDLARRSRPPGEMAASEWRGSEVVLWCLTLYLDLLKTASLNRLQKETRPLRRQRRVLSKVKSCLGKEIYLDTVLWCWRPAGYEASLLRELWSWLCLQLWVAFPCCHGRQLHVTRKHLSGCEVFFEWGMTKATVATRQFGA